jgi:hypothetical protein
MRIVIDPYLSQQHVADAVARAEKLLAPDVVRIRWNFEDDWTGDPSIFFRVVLADKAAGQRLRKTVDRVEETVLREVNPRELGLQRYFNFRTLSEQKQVNEKSWN